MKYQVVAENTFSDGTATGTVCPPGFISEEVCLLPDIQSSTGCGRILSSGYPEIPIIQISLAYGEILQMAIATFNTPL